MGRSLILALLVLRLDERHLTALRPLQALGHSFAFREFLKLWQALQIPANSLDGLSVSDAVMAELIASLERIPGEISIASLGPIYETLLDGEALLDGKAGSAKKTDSAKKTGLAKKTGPAQTRKASGIYYTPTAIVDYSIRTVLTQACSHSATSHLAASHSAASHSASPQDAQLPTVLDPACGGGAFLLAAYQFLMDRQLQRYREMSLQSPHVLPPEVIQTGSNGEWYLTQTERERLLLNHIYGVDLDPQAVEVTKLGLYLKLLYGLPERSPLPDLSHNLQCGNALIPSETFDWPRAFPHILPGGFDAVIGNPPYLDSEWMMVHRPDWRQYCTQHYQAASGNWDLFCVFVEKALQLCKPGGWISLVVPNKLASASYAAGARSLLTQQAQLFALRDYSQVPAFRAAVYPLVFVAQKIVAQTQVAQTQVPASVQICVPCENMQTLEQVDQRHEIQIEAGQPWPVTAGAVAIDRLAFPKLGDIAQVTGAATVSEAYALQPWIQDCETVAAGDLRFVNSGTIDRYCLLWGQKPLRYLGHTYRYPVIPVHHVQHLPPKRWQQAQQPKLVVAGMTKGLECAIDRDGQVLAGKSTTIVRLASPLDLRYLLGILNSRLITHYFSRLFAGHRLQGGYLCIGAPQLRQLPIWVPDLANPIDRQAYEQLIDWVTQRLMLSTWKKVSKLEANEPPTGELALEQIEQSIDRLICRQYQLTETEIGQVLGLVD